MENGTIFFDTETTGFPHRSKPKTSSDQPKLVQLAAILDDADGNTVASMNRIIAPRGQYIIPSTAAEVHKITTERAEQEGIDLLDALDEFYDMLVQTDMVVAHNLDFDAFMLEISYAQFPEDFEGEPFDSTKRKRFCTMKMVTPSLLKVPKSMFRSKTDPYKWPKMEECVQYFFRETLVGAHDAMIDTSACRRVFYELIKMGLVHGQ